MLVNPGVGEVGFGDAALGPPVPGQPSGGAGGGLPAGLAEQMAAIDRSQAISNADGSVTLQFEDPTLAGSEPAALPDNLAASISGAVLATISAEVIDGVLADRRSNETLFAALRAGLRLLGLEQEKLSEPFEGASSAIHPLMLDAVLRFVANAHAELYPANGPCKTQVVGTGGQAAPALEAVAQRKARWLNYFLTVVDEGYYPDCDAALLKLALFGSVFRKVYRDPVSGQPRSRFLTPQELLVSFSAPDLASAQRVTQFEQVAPVEARRRALTGYYRDVGLAQGDQEETPADAAGRGVGGRSASDRAEDAEFLHYHCHCWLDVPGFSHVDPESGEPTGLRLPWIVTVDANSREVLRLERDWRDGDPLFRRRDHYAHFLFHPGLGFYGWGLLTLLAGCTDTASNLWRQAMDAFTLASFPGGFRVKSARPEQSRIRVGPCEFPEVDTGGLPIQHALMPLPYKDVPPSFAPLLDSVVQAGQRIGQTVDLQVGEGRQDAPVGTTLALIEQAIRPTAAVIKRLYAAQAKELRLLAALFATSPGARYPYVVDGQKGVALAADFASAADVVPVCDPNAPTHTQRMALAEGKLRLAQSLPGVLDVRAAAEGFLRVMGADDAEVARLMPQPGQAQPSDVVTEFQAALSGRPLAAGPLQQHEAHIRAHIGQMEMPNLPPPVVQALLAHAGEHLALWYRAEASAALGVALPPDQPLPPEIEARVAVAVAEASAGIIARIGPALGGEAGNAAEMALERERLEFEMADSARKAEETARQDGVEVLKAQLDAREGAADRALKREQIRAQLVRDVARARAAESRAAAGKAVAAGRYGVEAGGFRPS